MSYISFPLFVSQDNIEKHPMEIVKDKGGLLCKNTDDVGFFKVFSAFAKKISGKVLKGKFNFSSMQRPTLLSIPESHLQVIAQEYSLAFDYFISASTVQNDVDRIKLIVAGIIGNMSFNILRAQGKGPVNPILGETFSVYSSGSSQQWRYDLS